MRERAEFVEVLRNDKDASKHKTAMYAEVTDLIEDSELNAPFAYAADDDVIKYTCSKKVYAKRDEIQTWFEPAGKYEGSFAISDIISALSEEEIEIPVGRRKEYWNLDRRFKPMEIFANLSSIDVLGLDEKEGVLQELFEAYKELTR